MRIKNLPPALVQDQGGRGVEGRDAPPYGLVDRHSIAMVKKNHYVTQVQVTGRILGAFAKGVWPGEPGGRQRFVQLLVDYTNPVLGARTISVPLLADHLRAQGWSSEARSLENRWGDLDGKQSILGIDVDAGEDELISKYPSVPSSTLRAFSYANLLFDEIDRGNDPLEVGGLQSARIPRAEVGYIALPRQRMAVSFGVDWLLALVVSAEELTRRVNPFDRFDHWWLSN